MIFTQRPTEPSAASPEPPDTRMDNDFEKKFQGRPRKVLKKLEKIEVIQKKSIPALSGAWTLNAWIRGPNCSTNHTIWAIVIEEPWMHTIYVLYINFRGCPWPALDFVFQNHRPFQYLEVQTKPHPALLASVWKSTHPNSHFISYEQTGQQFAVSIFQLHHIQWRSRKVPCNQLHRSHQSKVPHHCSSHK